MSKKLGIYVHLPFCRTKCDYCDFYSLPNSPHLMDRYQQALLAHFKAMSAAASGYQVDTVYFGGGTPTFYGGERVLALLRALKKYYRISRTAEITVEGNPDSATKQTLATLKRAGVNRISLGMQSAIPAELSAVGRIHSPDQTRQAVATLHHLKLTNFSLDLIYGLPLQTPDSWRATLEEGIALEPTHLSCYGLKVEEGTPLYHRVSQGETLPDDDIQAALYLETVARLKQAGYHHYEISNFAKKGCHSRHNMGYWTGKPYLGFGASASSDFGGYRTTNTPDLDHYCACVLEGGQQIFSSNELMNQRDRAQEHLMLSLRTHHGLVRTQYEKICNLDFTPIYEKLAEFSAHGWAIPTGYDGFILNDEGFLRSNQLISILLDLQDQSGLPKPPPIALPPPSPKPAPPKFEEDDWGQLHF